MTDPPPRADLVVAGASELLTCVPRAGDPLGRIAGGSVAVTGEVIVAVGSAAEIAARVDTSAARVVDATGRIVAPGFVDSHTHLVFGGSRAHEYSAIVTDSLDALKAGGVPTGILATVGMTRAESVEELTASASLRLEAMLRHGTTTVESKTGYGLSALDEAKMLEVNRRLQELQPVDVVSTFLGAHDLPPDLPRDRWVDLLVEELIPKTAEDGLAAFCDVYCDDGYYTVEESRRILVAGLTAGLQPKIHADAYSGIGASALAAEVGAVSADHLNHTDRATMRRLAETGVVGVVMPALDFAVQHPRPFDARAMLEEGMTLALATDLCPACWVESLQLVMALACRLYRLSPAEALVAATAGGAQALGLDDRGTLEPGKLADLQIWNVPTFEDVVYRIGSNAVQAVMKRGVLLPP